ncbi:MAG TPA: ABC transporter permease [Acidimicrobiales bacterium]|nr:ABC transporter permease [Acidimicrobiales bacterium]
MAVATAVAPASEVVVAPATVPWHARRPLLALVTRRGLAGLVTLLIVSVIIFFATQVLPGNAAYAVLGRTGTPARLHLLEKQLGLDRGVFAQYWHWLSGLFTGRLGTSLASGQGVWSVVEPRLVNSAILLVLAGAIGTIIGVTAGAVAALRKDGWFDHVTSVVALTVTALPEFVIAIALISLFATLVSHVLPAVSIIPPGSYGWNNPKALILPVATLVIVIVPYTLRMMRASTIEALESDYVEMARLKGVKSWRILLFHALPNAIAPTIQVIGLNFLYLAGGIVVVEYVYNYPGIGQGLVDAVSNRDIPVIQFIVIVLAAFYVIVNILTDVIALLATPRRRLTQ